MSLPKQNHAVFNLVIPSTGKTLKFRAFTVREEKILSLAQESKDELVIANAIMEIISNCFDSKLDVSKLTIFDIEYIITNIRAKSVGELVTLNMKCDGDPTHDRTPVKIDITKGKIVTPEGHETKIHCFDDVGVVMKYPTFSDMTEFNKLPKLDSMAFCIDYIYTGTEIFKSEEQSKGELKDFIENLTPAQRQKIEDTFFNKFPIFQLEFDYECMVCKHKHKRKVTGLTNFFI